MTAESPQPPSLIDWIMARRAAGLPIIGPPPLGYRDGVAIHAGFAPESGETPPFPETTERSGLADAPGARADLSPAVPENSATRRDEAPGITDPVASRPDHDGRRDTHAVLTPPASESGKHVNFDAPFRRENRAKPPIPDSTEWFSIADALQMLDRLADARLDTLFRALADQTRRTMLLTLLDGDATIGTLAAPHAMSLTAAAKHVAVLDRAGLVRRYGSGRQRICRIDPARLAEAHLWLQRVEARRRTATSPRSGLDTRLPPAPHPLHHDDQGRRADERYDSEW